MDQRHGLIERLQRGGPQRLLCETKANPVAARATTRSGLKKNLPMLTQGSSFLATSGLEAEIPLGFSEGRKRQNHGMQFTPMILSRHGSGNHMPLLMELDRLLGRVFYKHGTPDGA